MSNPSRRNLEEQKCKFVGLKGAEPQQLLDFDLKNQYQHQSASIRFRFASLLVLMVPPPPPQLFPLDSTLAINPQEDDAKYAKKKAILGQSVSKKDGE